MVMDFFFTLEEGFELNPFVRNEIKRALIRPCCGMMPKYFALTDQSGREKHISFCALCGEVMEL